MIDLSKLNPEQRKAVETTEGQVLILAGAGSGKTNTLMHRLAYLLDKKLATPEQLLVVTFTNKAAQEMKERVGRLVGMNLRVPWMGTFHSICAKILRHDGHHLGYSPSFTIYDTNDQLDVIKTVYDRLGINVKDIKPQMVLSFISQAKNELVTPQEYAGFAQGYFQQAVAQIYPKYQEHLKASNALDFDDLLVQTVRLFQTVPDVKKYYQQLFKYIMVDEYQDTNHVQYMMINLLAQGHMNIACVGDDDQSIYAFRGATIRNILEFERDYPKAVIIKLEQNYRSTQSILDASHQVISKNQDRKAKKLWTDKEGGYKITVYTAENEFDEGRFIAKKINELIRSGESAKEMAVLYRTNAQSRSLEEQFLREGIDYKVVGGTKFYERKEVKDILAYLRILYNPQDESSVKRIINIPKRGIGAKTISDLSTNAANSHTSLIEYLLANKSDLPSGVQDFARLVDNLRVAASEMNIIDLINEIISQTGYLKMLQDGTSENESRIENIKELISVAAKFAELPPEAGLSEFLTEVSLFQDSNDNEESERVTLMTVHAAKGLEFAHVFVAGMEEGLFPHSRVYTDPRELSEERRLAYVAITRAKSKLYLTHADSRTYFGRNQSNMVSRFIEDINSELLEKRSYLAGDFADGDWEEADDTSSHEAVDISVGDKVKHDYFGVGTVQKIDGGRAIISFGPVYGVKELMLEFAPIKKI